MVGIDGKNLASVIFLHVPQIKKKKKLYRIDQAKNKKEQDSTLDHNKCDPLKYWCICGTGLYLEPCALMGNRRTVLPHLLVFKIPLL